MSRKALLKNAAHQRAIDILSKVHHYFDRDLEGFLRTLRPSQLSTLAWFGQELQELVQEIQRELAKPVPDRKENQ